MSKALRAGAFVVVAGIVGVGWYGWQTIERMQADTETLTAEVERLATANEEQADKNDAMVGALNHLQVTVTDGLTIIETGLDDVNAAIGVDTTYSHQSLWDAVNELWTIIPDLAAAPPPIIIEGPTVQPAVTGPTAEWCAEYKLALENAGNIRSYVPPPPPSELDGFLPTPVGPSFGMNSGQYYEWVVVPLVEIGCPNPNE